MKKILFLGFSVTADKAGFAVVLRDRLPADEYVVDICGLGGFSPLQLLYFIDGILTDRPSDIVVLDLNTPAWRKPEMSAADYDWQIRYTIEAVKRTGAVVLFANFPRKDVDYDNDLASDVIRQICAQTHCAFYDLASELQHEGVIKRIIKDEVHVTAEGSEIYADRIFAKIKELPETQPKSDDTLSSGRFGFLPIASLVDGQTEPFERTGYSSETLVLRGGEQKTVKIDSPVIVNGALVVTSPQAGWITFEERDGAKRRFLAYDGNSYYNRFIAQQLTPFVASSIMISSGEELPEIKLLKGVPDMGARINAVAGLMISDAPITEIVDELRGKSSLLVSDYISTLSLDPVSSHRSAAM